MLSRRGALLALFGLAACNTQVEAVDPLEPAPCVRAADCRPALGSCAAWSCVAGACTVVPVGGRCTNGIPMCVGICVFPDGGPGHCEIPATSAIVCGGDGSCDDGDPCTIDQGLPGGCLHHPMPLDSGCLSPG